MVSFSVRVQDELRLADINTVEYQGQNYVSLRSLIGQLGGGCTILSDRIQVDLAGKSAWLKAKNTQVASSLGDFAIGNAVAIQDGDALMAVSDVSAFFGRAFRLEARADSPAAATPAASASPNPTSEATAATASGELTPIERGATVPPTAPPQGAPVGKPVGLVIIDPGHGGDDAGVEGPEGGASESAVTLAVARQLQAVLQQGTPIKSLLTRDKDRLLAPKDRASLANNSKGDLFVSIHVGAAFTPEPRGFEIFCSDPGRGDKGAQPAAAPSASFAERSAQIAAQVASALERTTQSQNRGVHRLACRVLGDVAMPGLLIEIGYLTNPDEAALLQTESYQQQVAQGIADGLRAAVTVDSREGRMP